MSAGGTWEHRQVVGDAVRDVVAFSRLVKSVSDFVMAVDCPYVRSKIL